MSAGPGRYMASFHTMLWLASGLPTEKRRQSCRFLPFSDHPGEARRRFDVGHSAHTISSRVNPRQHEFSSMREGSASSSASKTFSARTFVATPFGLRAVFVSAEIGRARGSNVGDRLIEQIAFSDWKARYRPDPGPPRSVCGPQEPRPVAGRKRISRTVPSVPALLRRFRREVTCASNQLRRFGLLPVGDLLDRTTSRRSALWHWAACRWAGRCG
jgi:hypothetical protein